MSAVRYKQTAVLTRQFLGLFAVALLAVPAFAAEPANKLTKAEKADGWMLLFDGKSLDGWEGDPAIWSAKDGMIVGSTDQKSDLQDNTFLIYRREKFSDFHLIADIKLRNHNTGIQFRSEDIGNFVVKGYQADAAEGNWWGSLYGEKTGRGVIENGWKGKGETVVKADGWNTVEVICQGSHIVIKLNGLTTVDIQDDMASSGILALQVHRGPKMQVSFRNLKLKKL
ncbi:MAG: DUF1080 domain-containing protein [Acidobacteria bacterium]|nr:DUF1080 domain-containing protein [Acidobacteriota bacterium]